MKYQKWISSLVLCIAVLSFIATAAGIFLNEGPGPYEYTSIRGESVMIYGRGIYQHMSAEVAPQGRAQDVVTMIFGIPALLTSLFLSRKGSLRGRLFLTGTLGYFLVTYLFYLVMGMYNHFFLVYVLLLSASFFAFTLNMLNLSKDNLHTRFSRKTPVKFVGGFLVFNAISIASLWLGIVVPPLLKGTIPVEVEHYTTLIVQGLDLGLLLPLSFLSGVLLIKKNPFGFLFAPVYIIFLSFLMTALTGKIVAMSLSGVAVGPPLVIIPTINLITILCVVLILKGLTNNPAIAFGEQPAGSL